MPAPVTHIKHALDYLKTRPDLDQGTFIRGTIFPDIRYLGVIDRSRTHRRGYTAVDVADAPGAWEAGRRFHSMVDDAWNRYFNQFHHAQPSLYTFNAALKAVEVTQVLKALPDRVGLATLLIPLDDEAVSGWGIALPDIERWQRLVQTELTGPIGLMHQLAFLERLEFAAPIAAEIKRNACQIADDRVWLKRIEAFSTGLYDS